MAESFENSLDGALSDLESIPNNIVNTAENAVRYGTSEVENLYDSAKNRASSFLHTLNVDGESCGPNDTICRYVRNHPKMYLFSTVILIIFLLLVVSGLIMLYKNYTTNSTTQIIKDALHQNVNYIKNMKSHSSQQLYEPQQSYYTNKRI